MLPKLNRPALAKTVRNVPILGFLLASGIAIGFQFLSRFGPVLLTFNVICLVAVGAVLVHVTYQNAVADAEDAEEDRLDAELANAHITPRPLKRLAS